MPSAAILSSASPASGRKESAKAIRRTGAWPMARAVAMPLAVSGRRSATSSPCQRARTPDPGTSSTSSITAAATPRPASVSASARLSGWRLCDARARAIPAVSRSSASSARASGTGRPRVRLPVLSSMARSIVASRSSAVPSLTMIPRFISAPLATTCATGTARPMAQGQVMISTAMAIVSDWCRPWPAISQPIPVTSARVWTAGA